MAEKAAFSNGSALDGGNICQAVLARFFFRAASSQYNLQQSNPLHRLSRRSYLACRDREAAVLNEAAVVVQVGEILTCGPTTCRMATGYDVRAARVTGQATAPERLGEVGTRALRFLPGHLVSLGAPAAFLRQPARLRTDGRSSRGRNVNRRAPARTRAAVR